MLKIEGTNIELTCGDSAKFSVSARDKNGELYEFQVGDKLKFTVKGSQKKNDDNVLVEIETLVQEVGEHCDIEFSPEDTKGLDFKKYWYDIQLTKVSGWVETIIENSVFKVGVEIG